MTSHMKIHAYTIYTVGGKFYLSVGLKSLMKNGDYKTKLLEVHYNNTNATFI